MEVTLNILAKDILENEYQWAPTCPITQALGRLGHTELRDYGDHIGTFKNSRSYMYTEEEQLEFVGKLQAMYATKYGEENVIVFAGKEKHVLPAIPIEDFSYTLDIPSLDTKTE